MANEFETDEDEVYFTITPRKLRRWDVLAAGLQTVSAVLVSVADGFRDVAGVMLRHSEYEQMQLNFQMEASSEIEQLIEGVENGTAK